MSDSAGRSRRKTDHPAKLKHHAAERTADVKKRGRSRAKKNEKGGQDVSEEISKQPETKKKWLTAVGMTAAALLLGGGGYVLAGQRYTEVFFPKTQINGVDASGRTPEEVEHMIAENVKNYVLTIEDRDGNTEELKGSEIGLASQPDQSLEKLLSEQKPIQWMKYLVKPISHETGTLVQYDETALKEKVNRLKCMDAGKMVPAENAYISEYTPGVGYTVVPETPGTVIKEERLEEALSRAVINLEAKLSLSEAEVYEKAAVTKEDRSLIDLCDRMNKASQMTVTYRFGDKTEQLNGDRIHEWMNVDENLQISVIPEKVAEYVSELANTYNTAYTSRKFKTSYGSEVEVKGGSYGWKIDQKEETNALIAAVQAGETIEREPIYSQTGVSRVGNDYGNTYVEINLTGQHLFFYKDGQLVVESDLVSGNLARGWGTPAGTYPLTYKQKNAVLKGANYRTPVNYWMPFNGGIGMHDAKWRGTFGGSIYKTNGSHGCINLPPSVAKTIFENISAGMPVICYQMPGTEKNTVTKQPSVPTPVPVPQPIPETPAPIPEQPSEAPVLPPSGPADEIIEQTQPPQTDPVPQPPSPGAVPQIPDQGQPAPQPQPPSPEQTLPPPPPEMDQGPGTAVPS